MKPVAPATSARTLSVHPLARQIVWILLRVGEGTRGDLAREHADARWRQLEACKGPQESVCHEDVDSDLRVAVEPRPEARKPSGSPEPGVEVADLSADSDAPPRRSRVRTPVDCDPQEALSPPFSRDEQSAVDLPGNGP